MKRSPQPLWAVLALFGLGVTGCASSPDKTATDVVDTQVVLRQADALLHRDPRIEELMINEGQKCMKERGFEVHGPLPLIQTASVGEILARIGADLTVEKARDVGYGSNEFVPENSPLSSWSQEAKDAYFGTFRGAVVKASIMELGSIPADGCRTQALDRAFGSAPDGLFYAAFPSRLAEKAMNEANTHNADEIDRLAERWQECMALRGETRFESWVNTNIEALKNQGSLKELAVKDAECRQEIGFRQFWTEKFARQFAHEMKKHEKEVLAYQEIEKRALEKAKP